MFRDHVHATISGIKSIEKSIKNIKNMKNTSAAEKENISMVFGAIIQLCFLSQKKGKLNDCTQQQICDYIEKFYGKKISINQVCYALKKIYPTTKKADSSVIPVMRILRKIGYSKEHKSRNYYCMEKNVLDVLRMLQKQKIYFHDTGKQKNVPTLKSILKALKTHGKKALDMLHKGIHICYFTRCMDVAKDCRMLSINGYLNSELSDDQPELTQEQKIKKASASVKIYLYSDFPRAPPKLRKAIYDFICHYGMPTKKYLDFQKKDLSYLDEKFKGMNFTEMMLAFDKIAPPIFNQ